MTRENDLVKQANKRIGHRLYQSASDGQKYICNIVRDDGRARRMMVRREDGPSQVDVGYCNAPGFLAPFRDERSHLNEFHGQQPRSAEEYFNMKHSKARNVIERCFGLLKGRWKILASPSFFPIGTQVRIILACCLLHNLIRKYMSVDPL
uniref:DDE Tnp4 domain-containing protein n=1 Tax=Tanacetum cinerariifolium TaxID=118510 RepID=A0A6L2LJN6_TANCI|nr:hypothetical protein [Tanacetum cinerariifolium]